MKILYVDDEPDILEQAEVFLERENESFEIITADSGLDGLRKIRNGSEFDAVVSDYKMSEMNGLEFLKKFRKMNNRIPFIILTGKSDEEVAIEALNQGAAKYFKKNSDPKEQYSLLADEIEDLVKQSEFRYGWKNQHSSFTPFLKEMLVGNLDKITPKINPKSEEIVTYPLAEEVLDDIPPSKIKNELETLTEEGIFERDFYDKVLTCPSCGGADLIFNALCRFCGSKKIEKEEALEHLTCGLIASRQDFKSESEVVCPKCGKNLNSIGVDYSRVGYIYNCEECGENFNNPEEVWKCTNCSEEFTTNEGDFENVYSYSLNSDEIGWLRKQLGIDNGEN